jgi:glutaredoxin 3
MAHYIVVTSKTCKWCDKVKELLTDHDHTFKEIDVATVKEFFISSRLYTVPQVFLNGEHIGGYEDTKAALEAVNG